jgi:hypothetical protein
MPSLADQLEAATIMGGDVVIPIGEFAAGIAGSPVEPLLMQHVRTEADGLSQADGKKKPAADEQMAGTAKKAEEDGANLTPLDKEREKVKQDILDQLNATKRFTSDIHEDQAELTATVLSNIARRAGKTIEQLFNGKPLKVQASGVFADALEQETKASLRRQLKTRGEHVASRIDLERRWNDGDRIFFAHDMGEGDLTEAKSLADLDGYTPDQTLALPADVRPLKQDAPAKPSAGHIEAMKREKVLNRLLECLSG